jgi:hypothetical protein
MQGICVDSKILLFTTVHILVHLNNARTSKHLVNLLEACKDTFCPTMRNIKHAREASVGHDNYTVTVERS